MSDFKSTFLFHISYIFETSFFGINDFQPTRNSVENADGMLMMMNKRIVARSHPHRRHNNKGKVKILMVVVYLNCLYTYLICSYISSKSKKMFAPPESSPSMDSFRQSFPKRVGIIQQQITI